MLAPPQDPTKTSQITFLEALEDKTGHIRDNYIMQQVLKNEFVYSFFWRMSPFSIPPKCFRAVEEKFEADKKNYLETGKLPVETKRLTGQEAFEEFDKIPDTEYERYSKKFWDILPDILATGVAPDIEYDSHSNKK